MKRLKVQGSVRVAKGYLLVHEGEFSAVHISNKWITSRFDGLR